MLRNPPTFIVCCPRSGSTWLRLMLNDHPEIACGNETFVFTEWAGLDNLIASYHGRRGHVGLGGYVSEESFYSHVRAFVNGIFNEYLLSERKSFLVEKSTRHALFLPTIKMVYPDAKLIHLVRDGRDVVVSLRSAAQSWNPSWPKDIGRCASMWKRHNEQILSSSQLFGAADILRIKYEDMLVDPETILHRAICLIGAEQNERTLARRIASSHQFSEYKRSRNWFDGQFFRKGTSGQWRSELSGEEIRAFKSVANDLLITLGYEGHHDW